MLSRRGGRRGGSRGEKYFVYRYRLGWEKHLFRIGAEKDTTTKNSHHTPLPRAHLHLVAPRRDLLRVHLGAWASREGGIKYNLPRWAFTLLQAVMGCFFSQSLLLLRSVSSVSGQSTLSLHVRSAPFRSAVQPCGLGWWVATLQLSWRCRRNLCKNSRLRQTSKLLMAFFLAFSF